MDIEKIIENKFNFLIQEYGYKKKFYNEMKEVFGNAFYVFESGSLIIKIIRERGQLFVEISSSLDFSNFVDIMTILFSCGIKETYKYYDEIDSAEEQLILQLDNLSFLIRNNYHRIVEYFGEKTDIVDTIELKKAAADRLRNLAKEKNF